MAKTFKRGFDMRDDDGLYTWKASRYPSVTKVLGPFDDFLWVHINKVKDEVTKLSALADAGLAEEMTYWCEGEWVVGAADPAGLLRDGDYVSKAGLRFLKRAADRGSAVDDMVMMFAQGMDPDPDQMEGVLQECIYGKSRSCTVDECLPYAKSYLAYYDQNRPDYVMGQVAVINDSLRYAGTPDYIHFDPGRGFVLQSLKTVSDEGRFSRGWCAQEAMYANAEYGVALGADNCGIEIEIPEISAVEWLVLSPESWRVRPAPRSLLDTWFSEFCLPAIQAHHAMRECPLPPTSRAVKTEEV